MDYENLSAALGWYATTSGNAEQGLRLASSLPLFWFICGLYREGLHWLDLLLAASDPEPTAERAGALWGAGLLSS